jgi:hypothetical protein
VRHGRELVEALLLQLLAATTGVPRADLKLILKHQFAPLDNAAWLPAADIAGTRVLTYADVRYSCADVC